MKFPGLMSRWAILVAAFLTLGATCTPPPVPPPPPGEATCQAACSRWRQLGCTEGDDTPDGESCEAVCALWERYWPMACFASVASCEDLSSCE